MTGYNNPDPDLNQYHEDMINNLTELSANTYADEVSQKSDDLAAIATRAQQELDEAVDKRLSEHNALDLTTSPEEALPRLKDRSQPLRLAGIQGSKKVPDNLNAIQEEDEPVPLDQFAEIRAQDGQLVFDFYDDHNLRTDTRRQLEELFERHRPLLEASFAEGGLLSVRYVVAADPQARFDAYYLPDTRELVLPLPADDTTVTREQLDLTVINGAVQALLRHEPNHTELADLPPAEKTQILDACNALRRAQVNYLERGLQQSERLADLLNTLEETFPPERRIIVQTLRQHIQSGTLESSALGIAPNSEAPEDSCPELPEIHGILDAITMSIYGDLEYSERPPLVLGEINDIWQELTDIHSLAINLDREDLDQRHHRVPSLYRTGLINEDAGALTSAALAHDPMLIYNLRQMSPEDQQAVVGMIRHGFDRIAERHSQFTNHFSDTEAWLLRAVHA